MNMYTRIYMYIHIHISISICMYIYVCLFRYITQIISNVVRTSMVGVFSIDNTTPGSIPYYKFDNFYYRVAWSSRMPYLRTSFSAKEPYN